MLDFKKQYFKNYILKLFANILLLFCYFSKIFQNASLEINNFYVTSIRISFISFIILITQINLLFDKLQNKN